MTPHRALSVAALTVLALSWQPACAEPLSDLNGSYEIVARLELPHLERWAVDKMMTVCLPRAREGELPIPVVSANNPFGDCAVKNLVADGSTLQYDIVCPGRGSASGHATYLLLPNQFSGRIAMVMGAKNMTMTEVQRARRLGRCSQAALESAEAKPTPASQVP
jgi:hypothetical protein